MKILYVGPLWDGSTTLQRMHAIESFGHKIIPHDTTRWTHPQKWNRILCSLAHRVNWGPNVWSYNNLLIDHARSIKHIDLIWVDKGVWLYPETLNILKQLHDCPALHFTPDPAIIFHKSRYFKKCIPIYEWLVTTKPFEVDLYRNLGAKNVIFVLQGFDLKFANYKPTTEIPIERHSDVCFIGHYERHYADTLKIATEASDLVKVWGPKWPQYASKNSWAKPIVYGGGLWGDDYLDALSGAKIGLGLLSKWIPETTTTRSFEIPALGTFLLAERTNDHLSLFEEGKEAEFFESEDELKDKINFYLSNDVARNKIAIAGQHRCLNSGYSNIEQMKKIFEVIIN